MKYDNDCQTAQEIPNAVAPGGANRLQTVGNTLGSAKRLAFILVDELSIMLDQVRDVNRRLFGCSQYDQTEQVNKHVPEPRSASDISEIDSLNFAMQEISVLQKQIKAEHHFAAERLLGHLSEGPESAGEGRICR